MKESEIQEQIVSYLKMKGYFVFAVPNGTILGANNNFRYANFLKKQGVLAGASDLIALKNGEAIFVEVKTQKGKLSTAQKQFKQDVEERGFNYIVARDVADIYC